MGTAMGLPKPGAAAVADADDDGGAGAMHPQGAAGGVEHEENVQPGEEVRDPQASATADALNSGTPDSEKLVDQSVEVKDETDESKTPILNAAKIEASKAKAMVEQLKVAATRLKFGRMKPMKPSKVAVWASYSSDRRILSEYVEALEKAAVEKKGMIVPCPPLARFCINPNLDVNPTHLSERKQRVKRGIDLVRMKGSFAVPTSFVSGNCHIDSMNLILFDVYMHVNSLLAGAQSIAEIAEAGMHEPQIEDAKAECRAAVHELRKTAHDIRASILDVGGLQLREPSLYWWDAFPEAMV